MAGPLIFFAGAGAGGYGLHRLKGWLEGRGGMFGSETLEKNGGKQSGASPTEANAAQREAKWPAWKIAGAGAAALTVFYIYAKFRPFR